MNISEMKQRKQEGGYSSSLLAEKAGLPESTVRKVFSGETAHPRYRTLAALEEAFRKLDAKPSGTRPAFYYTGGRETVTDVLREPEAPFGAENRKKAARRAELFTDGTAALSFGISAPDQLGRFTFGSKPQGTYTVDDYLALPDDVRAELIDGVLYLMSAPVPMHQMIAGEIYRQIANYIYDRGGSCRPYISPVDVQLDEDDRTMVQPDVLILCHPEKERRQRLFGSPDFVAEVTSPSTSRKDYIKKADKYHEAGVREYWIIDPFKEHVLTYFFEDESPAAVYPIDADIPVRIYDGELVIVFARIAAWIREAMEKDE